MSRHLRAVGRRPWPGDASSEWIAAIREWYADGDKLRMAALLRIGLDPPPEMADVSRDAVADALEGKHTRRQNHVPSKMRQTLGWRALRSHNLKQQMTAEKPRLLPGESINQKVADAINDEWRNGGVGWHAPYTEKHMATERTVARDAREYAKKIAVIKKL